MPSPSLTPKRLRGQCLCGRLHYEVADAFAYAVNCHCSLCRRTTGAAYKPLAGIARAELALMADEGDILRYGDGPDHNVNCRICGSFLYAVVRDGSFVHVAMGTLTDAPTIRPTAHIFVGSKAPWFTITDNLPQHDGHAPASAEPGDSPA